MKQITPFIGNILVPVQVVKLKFSEKEDVSLNPFQSLILEAIEDGCNIGQIAQATLLTEHVIKLEITQLVSQKILEKQEDLIELSELSRKILYVSRCVQRLNEEEKQVCINLVTGEIEAYNEERFVKGSGISALELQPRIRKQEIDGISMEENIAFFKTYLSSFSAMNDEQADTVLSSVYVEFLDTGEKLFRVQPVSRLPCLISKESEKVAEGSKSSFPIYASGKLCQIQFSLQLALPETDRRLLPQFSKLAAAGFLSEKGMRVARAYETVQRENALIVYYDYVSGDWQLDKPPCDIGKHRVDLQLPTDHELSKEVLLEIAKCIQRSLALPEELTLDVAEKQDDIYIVEGALWEADHA